MVSHEDWHRRYLCRVVHLKDGLIDRVDEQACISHGDGPDEDVPAA